MIALPYLADLFIYPIKSLDGVAVERATVLESGALKHDREWALFDPQVNFVSVALFPHETRKRQR